MTRFTTAVIGSLLVATTASAAPKGKVKEVITANAPNVGDTLPINGAEGWPTTLVWLYDAPSFTDATGKIIVHWFCTPKVQACQDDLARIVNLRENAKVYVIAYIGSDKKRDVLKLDPIRESEGVGNGTLAYGKQVMAMQKKWGFTGPSSIVVDVSGKITLVTTGSLPAELDQRDKMVQQLSGRIREFTTSSDGPKLVKVNEKFQLSMKIELASWLRYSKRSPAAMKLQLPPDIKCDNTVVTASQMKIQDQTLVASATCSGPRGSYEARGTLNFSYETPGGKSMGIGTESATWKFQVTEGLKP